MLGTPFIAPYVIDSVIDLVIDCLLDCLTGTWACQSDGGLVSQKADLCTACRPKSPSTACGREPAERRLLRQQGI